MRQGSNVISLKILNDCFKSSQFQDLLQEMFETISNGGNLLVDVGPTKEGTIPVIMQERLLQMGKFLNVNGAAVCITIENSMAIQIHSGLYGITKD